MRGLILIFVLIVLGETMCGAPQRAEQDAKYSDGPDALDAAYDRY